MTRRIFVVASGQSNALGGPGGEGGDQTTNSRVKVWSNNTWVTATLGVAPFATQGPPYRNNLVFNFCKKLQETQDADVYFVLVARGGESINSWKSPNGEQWQLLNAQVIAARASTELSGKTVDYFLWFQGEADPEDTQWAKKLLDFRDDCISSGWMKNDTPWLCGEIINKKFVPRKQLEYLESKHEWLTIVSNDNVGRAGDGYHFTADGYIYYGRIKFYRAATGLSELTKDKR